MRESWNTSHNIATEYLNPFAFESGTPVLETPKRKVHVHSPQHRNVLAFWIIDFPLEIFRSVVLSSGAHFRKIVKQYPTHTRWSYLQIESKFLDARKLLLVLKNLKLLDKFWWSCKIFYSFSISVIFFPYRGTLVRLSFLRLGMMHSKSGKVIPSG